MELSQFFGAYPSGALAFSGGVDSSLLVWAAAKYGRDWRAYYVQAAFQPAFERKDAERIAAQCGLPMTVIEADVLSDPVITANPPDRCYYCKQKIFGTILSQARQDGYTLVIDGTNASDDMNDRPGMRALKEMHVISPLRECGLTKADVRKMSREAGLFTWNKPAYACLATRIPSGTPITEDMLRRVERSEHALTEMGFSDLRVRARGTLALIQFPEEQISRALQQRKEILARLGSDFSEAAIDLKTRRSQ